MNGITPPDRSSSYTIRKRKYKLYHYGRTEFFGSKRAAIARQYEINHEMSVNCTAIGALAAEVYTLYRSYYLRLDTRNRATAQNCFSNLDRSIFLMVSRSHHSQGTTFTFKHYLDATRHLITALELFATHEDTLRNTFSRHRITELLGRAEYLAGAIDRLLGPLEN